jgi:oligopeptide transport system substrate-binding protein
MKRLMTAVVAGLVTIVVCVGQSRAGKPLAGKTLSVRLIGEPETLDWNKAHTSVETFVLMNLMEGLVQFDSSMDVAPALAESWKVSADRKTYTFKLRPNLKWSDGVPLKAKDFVYSWKRLLSPSTAASYAYFLFDIEGAEAFNRGHIRDFSSVGVKALNDSTLRVKLARPMSHWVETLTFWVTFPLREDVVEKYGAMNNSSWAAPGRMVVAGPYNLASHDYDSKILLKGNPNYYGTRGNIENIDFMIIKDDSTALTLYESGRLDFLTDISSVDLKRLAGRSDLKSFPYYKTGYLGYVTTRAPLNNVKVRRAIAMAIDKAEIGKILHGGQLPASSWVPPRMLAHSDKVGLPFDVARARQELKASGINTSKPIEMILTNWDKPLILAQFIQQELKKNLGLVVHLQQFDHKTFRAQVDLKRSPLYLLSWSGDFPDPDNFMSVFLSESGNNRTGWKSKTYDDLVLKARSMPDRNGGKLREKIYDDAQKILLEDDAVVLPLYYEPNMALVRSRVQGLELNPLNYLILRKVNLGS